MRLRTALALLLLSACGTSTTAPTSAPTAVSLSAKIPVATTEPAVKPDNADSGIDTALARNQFLSSFPCPQWFDTAARSGWPAELWPQLSYIIWRESRCHIDSHNTTDPYSGSRGLMQINGFWCRPNQYTDAGFLQDHSVLGECADLFDPAINLRAGWTIYQYSSEKHSNGWGPWAMKQAFEPPIVDQ